MYILNMNFNFYCTSKSKIVVVLEILMRIAGPFLCHSLDKIRLRCRLRLFKKIHLHTVQFLFYFLKGTVSRDFRPLVFSSNNPTWAPD
jgi:hypothetical protein